MDIKVLLTVFWTIFVAELGDKTQLATLLFASGKETHLMSVFAGATLALVVASGLAVFFGSFLSHHINPRVMAVIAGSGFIVIGVWGISRGLSGS